MFLACRYLDCSFLIASFLFRCQRTENDFRKPDPENYIVEESER